ncbi:hypothetical protein [Dendronalium sp. ChiSLP03b]|uniref:hypothetical protein n=1 Tax=Dendronalium sp. ChiSLP03b TaxID=3075381 RepID=UPI002AD4206B|nr:hypothetical protein [Dendronalium sp. ChiSLP03b]MDZ8203504.1 hypothetical protein [Dendronalium sp. ChiSLP03b]
MSLQFQHFDTRLNQWIHTDGDNRNPQSILTEKLDNTLLEFYFPDKQFYFGHIDEHSTPSDLRNHPDGHTLLLSSKTRLLYGLPDCLEIIDKLCPDRKDRGAYGSIFLGACKNAINEELNILVVDDATGENGNILSNNLAYKLVGDCYGQISTQIYDKLTKREERSDKSYRVIQHRFGWTEVDGEDTKYRFGKGTLRPYRLEKIEYFNPNNEPKIDLIIPLSSFKGTDKDCPGDPSKPQIQPGLYKQKIWLGSKSQSERGKTAISQLLASFPQGIKDFAESLEAQAQKLAETQNDPRKLAQLYCEKYEKRKAFTEEEKSSLKQAINEQVADGSLLKQLESLTQKEDDEELEINDNDDGLDQNQKDDLLMYKLIKADLLGGHHQLLETEKVRKELSRFVQNEWRDIALGRTLTFDRGMIIPSKELKNGEICVPWLDKGEKVLNFRSPFLNSNGLCVSTNKLVEDRLAPDGEPLGGIIVVNDEDHKRIQERIARLEAQGIDVDEIDPAETESERQARDFDGDCIGIALANKYPNFTAEAEYRNTRENSYAPTVKLKKQSFYLEDGTQPPFEEIAIHMSDSISVGVINNQVTALEALESEVEILKTYGTPEQKSEYLDQVSSHYLSLLEQEKQEHPKPIRTEYKPLMQQFVALSHAQRTSEVIQQAMDVNRLIYRQMIEEGCYQNQIAVDLFKSAKKPEMGLIKENQRYLYRDVNYIKDKKLRTAYLNSGITPTGYSPVELLINQTNKYFQQSQLESRPIVQFQDLFRGVEFTPQQKFAAYAAKYEFDKLFNAAVAMERRRETERGPSAVIQTQEGAKLEITNLTRYGHPLIWKAQTINLKLVAIDSKYQTQSRPHKLLAIAQIDGEIEDGKPVYHKLGTVSQQSVADYNLKPGMATSGATLTELKPEPSRGQTKLMFQQAYQEAEAYSTSIHQTEQLSAAAAAWSVAATRQDELEDKQQPVAQIQKKIPNFVFAAFPQEIISRLDKLQFTQMRLVTLDNEANNFKDKVWNLDEKYAVEIRASDHPPGHERYGSRLVFVQDSGEYKEFAALEPRTGQLPIGTKVQANVLPGETYTANATISVPGKEPVEFTIREISKFSHAGQTFNAEPVTLEIGTVPVPNEAVKIKLDGKTLGELDADSVKQLQAFNYIKDGNQLNLKLTTISESNENAFALATSPNGNLLKVNKINHYDYKGQTFKDSNYRKLTLEVPPSKTRDAVFLNGEPLGVLHFKKDKEALLELGVLNFGRLTPVQATLQSNFSTTILKVDPQTVEYPEVWTKETQVFGTQQVNQGQQGMIEKTAPILQKIKERPTILFATPEDKLLGLTQLAVDNHKVEIVTKWLRGQNIAIAQVPPEDVPLETKKGLGVFKLVNSSIPESVSGAMTRKFGSVIESETEYQQKVKALPDRPKYLKPPQPQQFSTSEPIVPSVAIRGKLISMNFPLMLHGEQNPLPVDTCIDAMRGYGRTHTTRAYEPYKQYGFQEGDIAIASGEDKQVVPFLKPQSRTAPSNEVQIKSVTIDNLREWYSNADKLGKSTEYKQRIVEVANQFKSDGQLSQSALTAIGKDKQELEVISRLTQIAQRIGAVWGQKRDDGFIQVKGKHYDLVFNAQQKDLAIAHKNGDVILSVQSGKIEINKVTKEILQTFEDVNSKFDEVLEKNQKQATGLQR